MTQVVRWCVEQSLVLKILMSVVRLRPGHQEQTSPNAKPCRLSVLFVKFAVLSSSQLSGYSTAVITKASRIISAPASTLLYNKQDHLLGYHVHTQFDSTEHFASNHKIAAR